MSRDSLIFVRRWQVSYRFKMVVQYSPETSATARAFGGLLKRVREPNQSRLAPRSPEERDTYGKPKTFPAIILMFG